MDRMRDDVDDLHDQNDDDETLGRSEFAPDDPEAADVDEVDEDVDTIPPQQHTTGENLEVSMEVDEDGNEVWFAHDSQVPGSTTTGHSMEEALDGVEERRKAYREMRRRSREKRERGRLEDE